MIEHEQTHEAVSTDATFDSMTYEIFPAVAGSHAGISIVSFRTNYNRKYEVDDEALIIKFQKATVTAIKTEFSSPQSMKNLKSYFKWLQENWAVERNPKLKLKQLI